MNNTIARTFALFLALMLWLVLKMEPVTSSRTGAPPPPMNEKTFIALPLHVLHDEAYDVSVQPETVQLTVKGDSGRIRLITPAGLKVTVDARGLGPGTYTLYPKLTEGGTYVTWSIEPATVEVTVSEKKESDALFPVDVILLPSSDRKDLESSYQTYVNPTTVKVLGTPKLVQTVKHVKVEIDPSSLPEDGFLTWSEQVKPVAYDAAGKVVPVQLQPELVTVLLTSSSSKGMLRRELPFSFNLVGAPHAGYTVAGWEITPNLATVEGDKNVLDQLKSIDLGDLSVQDATTDVTQSFELSTLLPKGVTLVKPQKVSVTIHIVPLNIQSDVQSIRLPVHIVGLDPGWVAAFVNPKDGVIQVELSGARDMLGSIEPWIRDGTIAATVNVERQQEGEITLPIKVQLPPGLILKSMQPEQATVLLKAKDKATLAPSDPLDGGSQGTTGDAGGAPNSENGKKSP